MGVIGRKFSSAKGETLAETVASILIIALASVIFATMALSATRLNAAANTADQAFYAELSAAETQTGTVSGTVTVSWGSDSQDFAVTCAGAAGELISYRLDAGGGGG
ncbi:MAG: hypothetical protein EOM52_00415 [Clostridia bacterium]|nr:hypothetical protein [Clostridia bacterium]